MNTDTKPQKPLFIPLYTRWYEEFKSGQKTTEYRTYGPRWNERTCTLLRPVTVSKGYGKKDRLHGVIVGFEQAGRTAKIHLRLDLMAEARAKGLV